MEDEDNKPKVEDVGEDEDEDKGGKDKKKKKIKVKIQRSVISLQRLQYTHIVSMIKKSLDKWNTLGRQKILTTQPALVS